MSTEQGKEEIDGGNLQELLENPDAVSALSRKIAQFINASQQE